MGRSFHPLQRANGKSKKKYIITAQRSVSEKASGRIARAPRLSCLYKQALIFLSTPGTSAIYSQPGGRVAWREGVARNSVTVPLGPGGLCARIDFTCKRGERDWSHLTRARPCHQRAAVATVALDG